MVYRLYSGTYSQIKQHVLQAGVVLGLTVGFPVIAAYLTQEALIPRPSDITENDSPGLVMGTSDTRPDNTGTDTATTDQVTQSQTGTTPSQNLQPTRNRSGSTTTTQTTTGNTITGGSSSGSSDQLPVGGSGGDPTPTPEPEPEPEPTPEPVPTPQDPPIMVELDLLDVAGAQLQVDPEQASADLTVGL